MLAPTQNVEAQVIKNKMIGSLQRLFQRRLARGPPETDPGSKGSSNRGDSSELDRFVPTGRSDLSGGGGKSVMVANISQDRTVLPRAGH